MYTVTLLPKSTAAKKKEKSRAATSYWMEAWPLSPPHAHLPSTMARTLATYEIHGAQVHRGFVGPLLTLSNSLQFSRCFPTGSAEAVALSREDILVPLSMRTTRPGLSRNSSFVSGWAMRMLEERNPYAPEFVGWTKPS